MVEEVTLTEDASSESSVALPSALLKRKAMDVLFEHEGEDLTRKKLRRLTEKSLQLTKGSLRSCPDFDAAAIIQEFACIQRVRADQPNSTTSKEAEESSSSPYSSTLLKAVFVHLNQVESFENLTLKDLRKGVEDDLGLPRGALKSQSNELKLILEDYTVIYRKRQERMAKGRKAYLRYSKKEEEIVMHYARDYLREHGLGLHVINYSLRGDGAKVSREERRLALLLFEQIAAMLPHRIEAGRKKNPYGPIQKFLNYKFSRDLLTGRWTEEEKQAVQSLVAVYGRAWTRIGKLMNKRAVDVKDLWRRIQGMSSSW